jgi:hypothetical protein
MYAMKEVASSVFRTMMFPHNRKIVTIDQVSHYEPNPSANLDNILPLIHTNQDEYPLVEMGLGIFKDPSLLGTYCSIPFHYPGSRNLSALIHYMDLKGTNASKTELNALNNSE